MTSSSSRRAGSPVEARHVAEADRRGWQIETHAIGDRGVRMTLDAYEHAAGEPQNDPDMAGSGVAHDVAKEFSRRAIKENFDLWREHGLRGICDEGNGKVVLLLHLHLLHKIVFILDLVLNLRQVSRGLAVCLLFQIILVLVRGQFRSYNNKN